MAFTAKSKLFRGNVKVEKEQIKCTDSLEYLGGVCTFNKGPIWTNKEPIDKMKTSLSCAKANNLKLNTITTTTMSKVISLPRYACSFQGARKAALERMDIEVAKHLRQTVGLDFTLSKAVLFNSKAIGGQVLHVQPYYMILNHSVLQLDYLILLLRSPKMLLWLPGMIPLLLIHSGFM